MDALAGILKTLNIDNTIWFQLGCFVVSYLALSNLIFKPYYAAFAKRKERTVGGEESAEAMVKETSALNEQYESRAREINSEFKTIYDTEKASATKEYNEQISAARNSAQELTEKVKGQIATEVKKAKEELDKEVPSVSKEMVSRLVGKEVTR